MLVVDSPTNRRYDEYTIKLEKIQPFLCAVCMLLTLQKVLWEIYMFSETGTCSIPLLFSSRSLILRYIVITNVIHCAIIVKIIKNIPKRLLTPGQVDTFSCIL